MCTSFDFKTDKAKIGHQAYHSAVLFLFLLQLSPEHSETYIEYLISIGKLDEAALKMADIVNDVRHWTSNHSVFNNI